MYRWCRENRLFALATVVGVSGSAPLPPGTGLAVDTDGNAVGSLSGGCVEGAVYELCRQALTDGGAPARARFGYSDDDAFAVGLTCGGEIEVLVQQMSPTAAPHLVAALDEVLRDRPVAIAHVVDGPEALLGRMVHIPDGGTPYGGLGGGEDVDRVAAARARGLLAAGRTGRVEIGGDAETCPERLPRRQRGHDQVEDGQAELGPVPALIGAQIPGHLAHHRRQQARPRLAAGERRADQRVDIRSRRGSTAQGKTTATRPLSLSVTVRVGRDRSTNV
nr:XdhC family protein [Nonomuraea sp. SYSU D8015]